MATPSPETSSGMPSATPEPIPALYVGLMSGTSLDGVDAVLADPQGRDLAFCHQPFDPGLRAELLALNRSGADELHRAALAANALARVYARATAEVLAQAGVRVTQVHALGAHGQTVRHQPQAHDGNGYTWQLLNGALLAELTGLNVVCDFRSRDVAAGGQGAPLVPAFHAARFASATEDIAVLNLGGIANLSLLPAQGQPTGFDCGPGNMLMDQWCQQRLGMPYDADGALAACGQVQQPLLALAMAEPFYALKPPKSTGRDLYDEDWVQRWLQASGTVAPRDEDVAATLAELTAQTAVEALRRHLPGARRLLVCGGGAYNGHLLNRLRALLGDLLGADTQVFTTASQGMAPDRVEALAFAWLAQAFMERAPGNLPAVTGARGPRVLGALYPAG